ncbi:MAG: zinc-binding dehydrogenase [Planctomycetes bacterium]|nr:zinc-binding dehydrogenase [Planctomycetota bacterium]
MYRCMNAGNIGIDLDWEDCLPLARDNGFEGIDVPVTTATNPEWCRSRLEEFGLRPGGIALPLDFRALKNDFRDGLQVLKDIAGLSAAIGQRRFVIWISPYSDERSWNENFQFHVDRLRQVADVLSDEGCRLGLEFIGPRTSRQGHAYPFIYTMGGMLDLCEAAGENVGLLLDSWHWYNSVGTVDEIKALDPEQIVYVHINDAPAGIPVEQQIDNVRALPAATGVIDTGGFLEALREIEYDGPVTPEPFVPELGQLEPTEAARQVGEALDTAWRKEPHGSLPGTMKVVALGGKEAWLVDGPVPRPQGREVIVKIHASPICGSNMGGWYGEETTINNGHEGAGEVVAVAQSNRVEVGDRVALSPLNACGVCKDCLRGDTIFCSNRDESYGYFAQFTRVADVNCIPIPADLDYETASLMGCCLGPPHEAVKRIGVSPYDTVVITGLGPVGLGATALSVYHGARVIALDPERHRREIAKKLGAEQVMDPTADNCNEALKEATGGDVMRAIECSGEQQAERMLIDLAGVRAFIAFVGENKGEISLSPSNDMLRKGLTLVGCWHMNLLDASDLIRFLRRSPEKVELLISHRYGFDQVAEAFETFASRKCSKVLLLPWQGVDA